MNKFIFYIAFVLLFISNTVFADNIVNTAPNNTQVNNTASAQAQDWGISLDEWMQYQKLMQGKDGRWYPKLSPAEVLGLNAKTPQEQQHFAEIAAKQEHDRLARELAFDNAFHQAMGRLFASEPVIKPFDMSAYNVIPAKAGIHKAQ